jgi:hypothetical protein
MAWIRLPLQALFIAWALLSTSAGRSRTERRTIEPAPSSRRQLAT